MGKCYVQICKVEVPRNRLMCLPHWKLVPLEIQNEVWKAYRSGIASVMVPAWQKARDAVAKALAAR